MKQKVLVCGAAGFIGRYVVKELIKEGFDVIGFDNLSKYIDYSVNVDDDFDIVIGDAKNVDLLKKLLDGCTHFIVCAAKIGGISYFHKYAYDLIAENERILASCFDAAIYAYKFLKLKKITVLSSSMVYENAVIFPSKEGDELTIPPPFSTYGLQKLCVHYFCKGAYQQYGLPYTILIPFNVVGIGEIKDAEGTLDSHVVPDFIKKAKNKQFPFEILGSGEQIRHFTYGEDLAKGVVLSLNNETAKNESFNLASNETTKIKDLASLIWNKINPELQFDFVVKKPFEYDVQKRIPDVTKAKKYIGFEAKYSVNEMLDIIIPWYIDIIDKGLL